LAALDKMTRCSASDPRDQRTWPFVTFSFGGTWRTESMYLHYPQTWMSCRNASLLLSTRSRRIRCRVWSELDYRIDVYRLTKGGHIECVCDTAWNCMSLCNCSHQFCKNIPVSFYFITTWNQGVFLWSLYIFQKLASPMFFFKTIEYLKLYRNNKAEVPEVLLYALIS